jgi:hypothetical protein
MVPLIDDGMPSSKAAQARPMFVVWLLGVLLAALV